MGKKTEHRKGNKESASDNMVMQLWSNIVRSGGKCEYPNCTVNYTRLQAHHFFTRAYDSIRYDPENGICLCPTHHSLGRESAHHDPLFWQVLLDAGVRDEAWLANLVRKRNHKAKRNQEFKNYWYKVLSHWGVPYAVH